MPLDGTNMPLDGKIVAQATAPLTYDERWSVKRDNAPPKLRNIQPLSDAQALYLIWQQMETKWCRRFNDGDNHCVVGWVAQLCEPLTVIDGYTEQSKRLMQRLHDALPKSAQRACHEHRYALARYNDTHSQQAIRTVVMRAYTAELNARINALNTSAASAV